MSAKFKVLGIFQVDSTIGIMYPDSISNQQHDDGSSKMMCFTAIFSASKGENVKIFRMHLTLQRNIFVDEL